MIKKYETRQAGINFKLVLKDNIILIGGLSGSGKTLLFDAFQSDKALNPDSNIIWYKFFNRKKIYR